MLNIVTGNADTTPDLMNNPVLLRLRAVAKTGRLHGFATYLLQTLINRGWRPASHSLKPLIYIQSTLRLL